jgi:hypothetical protein
MEKYKIHDKTEETACAYCGQPLDTGDTAYMREDEEIVCSYSCSIELTAYIDGSPSCPLCDCNDNNFLGLLGNLAHFRCGNCGIGFNYHITSL